MFYSKFREFSGVAFAYDYTLDLYTLITHTGLSLTGK